MIKSAYFPNQTFETKEALFNELKTYKDKLINLKRATILNSDSLKNVQLKRLDAIKGVDLDDEYTYHVINTTKYLDSHGDVHTDSIWTKSVKEQQGKVYFVADHDLSIKSVIAYPEDVEMYVDAIEWKNIGVDLDGTTNALIFKVKKTDIQLDSALDIITNKRNIEHSVRMQYVKIDLAINDSTDDFKAEKGVWDSTIDTIANKEVAIEQGYFWRVSEAKISQEGSMVLKGSNDATPILQQKVEKEVEIIEEVKTFIPTFII